jgi:hypothetical protein
MAARKKAQEAGWNNFAILPDNGTGIVVKDNESGEEIAGTFSNGGIVLATGETYTVSALPYDVWKSAETKPDETKPAETKPDKSKRFSLNISDEDLHRYISDGLKADSGVSIVDMWTNSDGGFIVYGSGLGKVTQ